MRTSGGVSVAFLIEGTVVTVEHGGGDCTLIAHRHATGVTMNLTIGAEQRKAIRRELRWKAGPPAAREEER